MSLNQIVLIFPLPGCRPQTSRECSLEVRCSHLYLVATKRLIPRKAGKVPLRSLATDFFFPQESLVKSIPPHTTACRMVTVSIPQPWGVLWWPEAAKTLLARHGSPFPSLNNPGTIHPSCEVILVSDNWAKNINLKKRKRSFHYCWKKAQIEGVKSPRIKFLFL